MVKLLLGPEEVNPDKADDYGKTSLLEAAENGHEGVAKILLRLEEVHPDEPDNGCCDSGSRIPLAMDMRELPKYYLDGKRPALMSLMMAAKHPSRRPLTMGVRQLSKYYSEEKRSALTSPVMTAKHRSRMPLRMDLKELSKNYLDGKRSALISLIVSAKRPSGVLPKEEMTGWLRCCSLAER